jgi:methyl acetate hydrolase
MYQAFEQALAAAIADGRVAGVVALVADRDGVTYEHAAGLRAAGGEAAMDPSTVFWIASMTKAVVSVAALQLVEQGRLSLDGDLSELLPDLRDLEVLEGFGADGKPKLRPARGPVTLRQLLTHTSGFAYPFTHPDLAAYAQTPGVANPNDGARASHRQPLMFDPGQGWVYGIGIDWAGIAIEAASGQRLDAYLAQHIFEPLGMTDTTFALSADQEARKAGMHMRGADGALAPMPFSLPPDPEVLSGGGGLSSTARDYGRFLRMLLNGGELDGVRVLSQASVEALGQVQTGEKRAGHWTSAIPYLSRDVDLYPGMHTGWGLATLINPDPSPDGRSAGSLAWAGLGNTYYWADPAAGKAGVLLAQLLPFGDPEILALFAQLERAAYGIGQA